MQNSDESLEWLPRLIRNLVAEYLGDIDDPLYESRLKKLTVLISPRYVISPAIHAATSDSHSVFNFDQIKRELDNLSQKEICRQALKQCHAEATSRYQQYQTRQHNAIMSVPTDVWTSKILPNVHNRDLLSWAYSCRHFNSKSQPNLSLRKRRQELVKLVMNNKLKEVRDLLNQCVTNNTIKNRLVPDLLRPYQGCIGKHSPFYVAAMCRNWPAFHLLISMLPQQHLKLYDLVYLVISNQGKMQGEEWQFDVAAYLNEHDPYLIFEPGPDGLSPLQIAAADKDIHMLLALLKPLTNNPSKLEELRTNLETNNEMTLKEKWEMCVRALLKDLPSEAQSTTLHQLQAVQENGWLIDEKPYLEAYNFLAEISFFRQLFTMDVENKMLAIVELQRTMPIYALADIYCHSHGSNDPAKGPTPCYYERSGSRALIFYDLSDRRWRVFNHPSDLSSHFSLMRANHPFAASTFYFRSPAAANNISAIESGAIARHFEVRTEQLDTIVNALQLLQQEVNNIGPTNL